MARKDETTISFRQHLTNAPAEDVARKTFPSYLNFTQDFENLPSALEPWGHFGFGAERMGKRGEGTN